MTAGRSRTHTTPYNRLADIEWRGSPGEARSCGGNGLMRAATFQQLGGFDANMIAGEEPELCLRIRRAGYRVWRLDRDMGIHDASMYRFAQWWRRQRRSGHAYAERAYIHRDEPDMATLRDLLSILVWGAGVPAVAILGAWSTAGASLLLLGAFAFLWVRIYRTSAREGLASGEATLYATACVLGKSAQLRGVATFAWNRLVRKQRTTLIEYKATPRKAENRRHIG
jgi:GT2 family glycosyltransferase